MLRFYLRLILIPTVLFTAVLLVIRAQPYDDHELRQLLLPEGCPAPCFMGIRPGVTTMDEAFKILQASKWVNHIEKASVIFNDDVINWSWSDQKPKKINQTRQGEIWASQYSEKPLVGIITIYSSIQLGDVQLVLGLPDSEVDLLGVGKGNSLLYFAIYANKGLSFQSSLPCNVADPYKSIVDIRISARSTSDSQKTINTLSSVFRFC